MLDKSNVNANASSALAERTSFSATQVTLTPREAEVLAEIVEASSNKEAAQHLGISPRTIENHRAHIMTKLGAKNTADLVRITLTDRRH